MISWISRRVFVLQTIFGTSSSVKMSPTIRVGMVNASVTWKETPNLMIFWTRFLSELGFVYDWICCWRMMEFRRISIIFSISRVRSTYHFCLVLEPGTKSRSFKDPLSSFIWAAHFWTTVVTTHLHLTIVVWAEQCSGLSLPFAPWMLRQLRPLETYKEDITKQKVVLIQSNPSPSLDANQGYKV